MIATRTRKWSPVLALLLLAGCGGSSRPPARAPRTTGAPPSAGELLSVPSLGRIYGRCRPGDRRWTIAFLATPGTATDRVSYRIGSAGPRVAAVNPGEALALRLLPGPFTSHQPADPAARFLSGSVRTTVPVRMDISQATEPHIFVVTIRLAVAAAIGDTTDCALVASTLYAATYYPGGQPPS